MFRDKTYSNLTLLNLRNKGHGGGFEPVVLDPELLLELLLGLGPLPLIDVGDANLAALLQKSASELSAKSLRPAGDDGAFAANVEHF